MKTVGIFMSTGPLIILDYTVGQRPTFPALPLFSTNSCQRGGPPFLRRLLYICFAVRLHDQDVWRNKFTR
ncbi:hypothetical protein GHT06_014846 [Daphnia sinensis]|uniref:Uncharacterized protein n=1 Tax=Daphnia sinensis TaxID=1820382 RepID=A0AAD5LI17_9CRUS|nr:hypothetical protein GHT06_014846 [Daphnia sinensis]